ncbi:P-loop NTPase family protein [Staphylococcus epidermidis]|uniref:hypothetical protein n=1 Tax=Staphylococcus epidermidis TaxID=1282 RepID=UPI00164270F9|nr:hypothetical protein [Staphylococcus epidermidis]
MIVGDEPTASVDRNNGMGVMKIVEKERKERNKTCVIVSDDEGLSDFCDKRYLMEDGVV